MDDPENKTGTQADRDASEKNGWSTGKAFRFASIGAEMTMPPITGAIIGHYLDLYFKTDPAITVIAFLVGLVGGFTRMIHDAKLASKELNK
jgi:F0F1-type ATP synthase assembly protein I